MAENNTSCGCGGCVTFILGVLLIVALIWGLPTSWGTLEVDIFPPGIYLTK